MAPPTSTAPKCPRCGEALPADSVGGLCPRCLMVGAMQPTQAEDAASPVPPLSPEQLAPHFPQLEILACLGRGGMGVVYKARQKSLNRLVALKLLAPERADDPQFAARFEKEAHALAALNHPHIVAVYDFGVVDAVSPVDEKSADAMPHAKLYFLLMEFVDGVNLRQLLQAKKLTPKEALSIVPPVCEALQCAHDHGIVYRDIKPENLLIDKNGAVKIADFGIAKIVAREADAAVRGGDSQATRTGASASLPLGTPDYAAPEQRTTSGEVDHRADIYSFGVVLYEMLTGERPREKIEAPSKRVQVDVRIDEIVLRALEVKPELRFATAMEFRTQVEAASGEVAPVRKTADAPTTGSRKAVGPAAGIATFFGLVCLGIPFVDMFRVNKDSAYLAVCAIALVLSIFAANLVSSRSWLRSLSLVAWLAAVPVIGLAAFFAPHVPEGFDHPSSAEAVLVPLCFIGAIALPWAAVVLWRASVLSSGNSTANRVGRASLALIFSLMTTALGAFAAIQRDVLWLVPGLAVLFAMVTILLALPVRREATGKGALIIIMLGMILWPLIAVTTERATARPLGPVQGREMESVEVSDERVMVKARGGNDAGMIFLFGNEVDRWTPSGLVLDSMFEISLTSGGFTGNVRWQIKLRHGRYARYRLEGPAGSKLGKIVFNPGRPVPDADGVCVIGGFKPDEGAPLPIAVKLERTNAPAPAEKRDARFPAGAHITREQRSILVTHDRSGSALHYVLFYEGDFGTSSSGSQNITTNTWTDEGAVKLKNGRTFGYRREALYPDELQLNGTRYDLRKGRVIVLHDDGTAEQFRFFPTIATASDPAAVSCLIHYEEAEAEEKRPDGEARKTDSSLKTQNPVHP